MRSFLLSFRSKDYQDLDDRCIYFADRPVESTRQLWLKKPGRFGSKAELSAVDRALGGDPYVSGGTRLYNIMWDPSSCVRDDLDARHDEVHFVAMSAARSSAWVLVGSREYGYVGRVNPAFEE